MADASAAPLAPSGGISTRSSATIMTIVVTVTIETVPALFLAMSPAPYTRRVLCPSIATIISCSGSTEPA